MNLRSPAFLALIIGFQVLILAGMFAKAFYPLAVGKEITLKVLPRDPRDLFRGDYVDLNYSFSTIYLDSIRTDIATAAAYHFGDWLHLQLAPKNGYYEPVGLWAKRPDNCTCLHVTPTSAYDRTMYLTAGIESYFTDSKNAKKLEDLTRWGNADSVEVAVKVMLTSGGAARIKAIEVRPKKF